MFGAAAAAGALASLRARQVRHLLSFTAQQASGISCWMRDGKHVEKAFDFGGMPARNGVAAATMVRAVLPQMLEAKAGTIVLFGSADALRGRAGSSAYAASKGALLRFSEWGAAVV